jgi:hypothetical protein
MCSRKNPSSPSALEYALEQLEALTASIIAGLSDATSHPEAELSSHITQQVLLRGQLLHEANALVQYGLAEVTPQEQEALVKKLAQLQVLHAQMGSLLHQHHEQIKAAIHENSCTHTGVKAYQKTQVDTELQSYLNDA